jgi:hypothetical protein
MKGSCSIPRIAWALLSSAGLAISAAQAAQERPPLSEIPAGGMMENFELIRHEPLFEPGTSTARGGNGNDLSFAGDCMYVSTRLFEQPMAIVDISDPENTKIVGQVPFPQQRQGANGNYLSGADQSTVESANLLIQQVWNTQAPYDGNAIELFDVSDCANPVLASRIELPDGNVAHEHATLVTQDGRILLYQGFTNDPRRSTEDLTLNPFPDAPLNVDIRVYDITDKENPVEVANWGFSQFGLPVYEPPDLLANGDTYQTNYVHQVSWNEDGTRMYVSASRAGFFVMDNTPLALGQPCDLDPGNIANATADNPFGINPNACLKKLHPDINVRLDHHPPFSHMHTHTATKVPNRPYVVLNDESGPCPYSWLRFVWVGEGKVGEGNSVATNGALFPAVLSSFMIPENSIERCPETVAKFTGAGLSFNAHKPLVLHNLLFTTWLAGGLRAVDISDIGAPTETGYFFPGPVAETARSSNSAIDAPVIGPEIQLRSYPFLRNGMLYVLDGASGVYVVRYTGPRADELPETWSPPNLVVAGS